LGSELCIIASFFIILIHNKYKNNITLSTIKHLINLPYSYFDDRGEGNILYRLGFSSQLVDLICNKMVRTILSSLGVLILSLYTIYRFSSLLVPVLLMILLLGILVMFFNFYILSEKDEELSKESKYKELEIEIVSNIFILNKV
ncbi:ABC transporter transmembrane domain-containing protein, partial [Streptococcus sp. 2.1]|uniref:ABC transporter transmembrane domain-containing protein n=1 Tax=Streptococcus sp. 2.1 TaxID=2762573 RepID=UPI001913D23C